MKPGLSNTHTHTHTHTHTYTHTHTHTHTHTQVYCVPVSSYWLTDSSKEDEKSQTEWALSLLSSSRHHTETLPHILQLRLLLETNCWFWRWTEKIVNRKDCKTLLRHRRWENPNTHLCLPLWHLDMTLYFVFNVFTLTISSCLQCFSMDSFFFYVYFPPVSSIMDG